MELVLIGTEGLVAPFCRMVGDDHRLSAVTGPCFDPSGTRLYISSLRGRGEALVRDVVEAIDWGDGVEGRHVGVTYEVSGPFRSGPPLDVASVSTTTVQPTASPATTVVRDATAMTAGTTTQTAVTTFPPTVPPTTTLDRASGQVDMPASGTGGAALGLGAVAVLALGAGVVPSAAGVATGREAEPDPSGPDQPGYLSRPRTPRRRRPLPRRPSGRRRRCARRSWSAPGRPATP